MSTPPRWSPKNNLQKNKTKQQQLTRQLTQSNQWVRVAEFSPPPMTSYDDNDDINNNDKRKGFLTCMTSIKCRSLTREKKIDEGTHTCHTNTQTKIIVI